MGLMRSIQSRRLDLEELTRPRHILPDVVAYWSAYPLDRMPLPFHVNALVEARFDMTEHIQQLNELALSQSKHLSQADLRVAMLDLRSRVAKWYDELPHSLRRDKVMPFGLFELQ